MNNHLLTHEHPVDGAIEIREIVAQFVELKCRWPLDLELGDWFELEAKFGLGDYTKAVANAASAGTGTAVATEGSSITFTSSEQEGTTILEISRGASYDWAATSLRIKIARPLVEFADL